METIAVGIDIGGNTTRIGFVRPDGVILERRSFPTDGAQGPNRVIEELARHIENFGGRSTDVRVAAAGVGAAVVQDPNTEQIVFAGNLPAWKGVYLKERLHRRLPIDWFIDNDANMATLGETRFGAGRGHDNVVCITVGTGVGCGIVLDGQLVQSKHGFASEVGHMPVSEYGPNCSCGGYGHLESYLAGPAISREYCRRLADVSGGLLMANRGAVDCGDARAVSEAAQQGDRIAIEVIRDAGRFLGVAAATIVCLLDPEVIVVGGGVSEVGDLLLDAANRELHSRVRFQHVLEMQLVRTQLGDDAGTLGAAWFAMKSMR